jgi:hypothetical protein
MLVRQLAIRSPAPRIRSNNCVGWASSEYSKSRCPRSDPGLSLRRASTSCEGDVLIVTRLDRLCRSTGYFSEVFDRLERKKVAIGVLDLGINTNSPAGRGRGQAGGQQVIGVPGSAGSQNDGVIPRLPLLSFNRLGLSLETSWQPATTASYGTVQAAVTPYPAAATADMR